MTHGKTIPSIQMPLATCDGSWTAAITSGQAMARRPSATAPATDADQRAATNANNDTSNSVGSSAPPCWAATTGTRTRPASAATGTCVVHAHQAKPATGTSATAAPAADDASVATATTHTARATTGTARRRWSIGTFPGCDSAATGGP